MQSSLSKRCHKVANRLLFAPFPPHRFFSSHQRALNFRMDELSKKIPPRESASQRLRQQQGLEWQETTFDRLFNKSSAPPPPKPRGDLEQARMKALFDAEQRRKRRIELREEMMDWLRQPEDSWRDHLRRYGRRADPKQGRLVTEFSTENEPFEVFHHIGWGSYRTNHLKDKDIFIIDDYMLANEFYWRTSYPMRGKVKRFINYYKEKLADSKIHDWSKE